MQNRTPRNSPASQLTRILHDGWRHAISAASEPARRAGSARPRIASPRKQFAFSVMSGVNPEEPLWQRPERRFRPFGRIFREKCGLRAAGRTSPQQDRTARRALGFAGPGHSSVAVWAKIPAIGAENCGAPKSACLFLQPSGDANLTWNSQ
jgi:hypothetical protein